MHRGFYGASYLFDQIGKIIGVEADLKACFPDTYEKILSIAYFLILEEHNSLSRFSHWQKLHIHPYGEDITSHRSSELFQSIEEQELNITPKKLHHSGVYEPYIRNSIATIMTGKPLIRKSRIAS